MAVYSTPNGEELLHYGIKRRSGRYPYGSGENPYQSAPSMQKKRKTYGDLNVIERAKLKYDRKKAAKAKEKKAEELAKEAEARKKAEAKKTANEKAKEMSDEEIYSAIQRLRLEQTYVNLVKELEGGSRIQNGSQSQQTQQVNSQQIQAKAKSWLDTTVDKTKKYADLSTNIGNIAKGANTAYASIKNIERLMNGLEATVEKKAKK